MGVNNMNKKILIISVLAVLMLVSISFVSAAEVNTDAEKKDSPLYGIRTRRAITEKIDDIVDNIRAKFIGERMFFIPSILRCFSRTPVVMGSCFPIDETCGICYTHLDGIKIRCKLGLYTNNLYICENTHQPAWCILQEVKG
jgi:hypothetical protein